MSRLRLSTFPQRLAVCRLPPSTPVPSWVRGEFTSVTRTPDELSVICDEDAVPGDEQAERGWRMLRVEGPIPFEMTGVAAGLVGPLAQAGISVFLLATYDTDYLLLKEDVFERGLELLRATHDVA
jgi:hypothetical protein